MRLWRISNYSDLSGQGGLVAPGRWHNQGVPVVYLAESPSAGLLEVLAHMEMAMDDLPDSYQLLEVALPETAEISTLASEALPGQWCDDLAWSRSVGDEWIARAQAPLLRVPSVLVPHTYNYLFNPRHPQASAFSVVSARRYPFDERLLPDWG